MRIKSVVSGVLVLAFLAAPAFARPKKGAQTEPGSYKEWREDIDEIEIISSFKLGDYQKVVVLPFDTEETPLPDKDDNTYEPVTELLADPEPSFVEALDEQMDGKIDVAEGAKSKAAGTLLLRIKVDELDPGSQAARYWAGFGAGAARAKVSGELIDAASGKTLLRFTQERRSGTGWAGGSYESLMKRNLKAIGEDVALILTAF